MGEFYKFKKLYLFLKRKYRAGRMVQAIKVPA
jgi:hypothetical protein